MADASEEAFGREIERLQRRRRSSSKADRSRG
jgi:hypothetical protein